MTRREPMPVLSRIHALLVSTLWPSWSLLIRWVGVALPQPTRATPPTIVDVSAKGQVVLGGVSQSQRLLGSGFRHLQQQVFVVGPDLP